MSQHKILHVIKTLNLGGAETNLLNLLRESKDSEDYYLAYSYGGKFEEEFRNLGISFYKYAGCEHKVKSFASLAIILKLALFIRRNKIQIVHTHNYNSHVWGALAGKLAGAKVVEHVHDFRYEKADYLKERGLNPKQFKTAVFFSRFSDRILVLTKNNQRYLIENGVPAEKIVLIPNGVPLGFDLNGGRPGLLDSLSIPSGKKILLSAARISVEKNIGFLLDIASQLKREDILFLIAGDGSLKKELEERTIKEGLEEKVKFIGFYPDVKRLLGVSTLFLQPTLLELHSITMLEAMSMGVPALVSKGVGCNDDFIENGKNGFLLDPCDAKAWAKIVGTLLDDEKLSAKVAGEGQRLIENQYDIEKTVKAIEGIYRELVREE